MRAARQGPKNGAIQHNDKNFPYLDSTTVCVEEEDVLDED